MLGFWGLEGLRVRAGRHLAHLPDPPAFAYAGFLIAADTTEQVGDVTEWAVALRQIRPELPIGIVVAEQRSVRLAALQSSVRWTLVIGREEFRGPAPSADQIEPLLSHTLPVRIAEAWARAYGDPGSMRDLLLDLAELAAAGRGVVAAAKHLSLSRASLYRRLDERGYPAPGLLLRQGRVAAYDIRVARGMDWRDALHLGGWSSAGARDKVMRSLGKDRPEVG